MYYAFGHVKPQVCVKIGKIHRYSPKKKNVIKNDCTVNTIYGVYNVYKKFYIHGKRKTENVTT